MGKLIYGTAPAIAIDDRVLRHVQWVMIGKLRRNEPFAFNWDQEPGVGVDEVRDAAHGSIWISDASQLYFQYDGPRTAVRLNPAWLEALMQGTYRPEGLSVLPEPAAP